MGKREINKQEKNEALRRAGLNLFADQGFEKTTIADLAAEAGIAKGTFYLYYTNKEELRDDLIAKTTERVLDEAWEHILGMPELDAEEMLVAVLDFMIDFLESNPVILKFIRENITWKMYKKALTTLPGEKRQKIRDRFVYLMEKGGLTCEKPGYLNFTLLEYIYTVMYACVIDKSPSSLEEYRPYMNRCICQIIKVFLHKTPEEEKEAWQKYTTWNELRKKGL